MLLYVVSVRERIEDVDKFVEIVSSYRREVDKAGRRICAADVSLQFPALVVQVELMQEEVLGLT